jgi:nuclear GTP-binding protein
MASSTGKETHYANRLPKRLRKTKDLSEYSPLTGGHGGQTEGANPLSRKNLKKDAKRARKAGRMAVRHAVGHGGMDVDEEMTVEVGSTFMA